MMLIQRVFQKKKNRKEKKKSRKKEKKEEEELSALKQGRFRKI